MDSMEIARQIVDIAEERKAEDIMLLDLRPDTIIADFFVICNGYNDRHIGALVEYIRQGIKDTFKKVPYSVDGDSESGWVILDYGDIVVHVFDEEIRDFYDIEQLWAEEGSILLSIQ